MDMTIDEIIGHCNRTCEMAEMVANERGQTQDDITSKRYWEHYHVAKYLEELKRMKDAEEQGLLLRLPCKVGSRVYEIVDDCNFGTDCYTKMKCDGCEYRDLHIEPLIMASESTIVLKMQDFGKTVFLTREEAEAELAEKGGA